MRDTRSGRMRQPEIDSSIAHPHRTAPHRTVPWQQLEAITWKSFHPERHGSLPTLSISTTHAQAHARRVPLHAHWCTPLRCTSSYRPILTLRRYLCRRCRWRWTNW
jgi:hypothetical protein